MIARGCPWKRNLVVSPSHAISILIQTRPAVHILASTYKYRLDNASLKGKGDKKPWHCPYTATSALAWPSSLISFARSVCPPSPAEAKPSLVAALPYAAAPAITTYAAAPAYAAYPYAAAYSYGYAAASYPYAGYLAPAAYPYLARAPVAIL
ncbi:hypothetical protein QAD02_015942 [Eretmocerus hayati]|uniref:Uncharacterized protein n=1 Tax=Eretmocerus hayati TaxID=131215 RepID=A0ACC2P995_9HYME|nr:hypothetical protein QAD02_015942 [Eretmocerus hayati]